MQHDGEVAEEHGGEDVEERGGESAEENDDAEEGWRDCKPLREVAMVSSSTGTPALCGGTRATGRETRA